MTIKENFCPTCALVPLAIAGAGTSAAGMTEKQKKRKMIITRVSIIVTVISILLFIYFKFFAPCKACNKK